MVKLTIVKNPFEPWNGREQKTIEPGLSAKELVEQYKVAGTEMLVVVNGNEVDENYITKDGDFVVISAVVGKGGKNIFGMILAIGLSVFAGAIIGANALAGIGITSGTFGAYAVATAVMFIGNFLVGRMMGQGVDVGSYGGKNDATYSWAGIQTMQGQNNAVALTYGTVVSGGQTIGKYVNTVDNDEYLNWLVACGEGTLEITDIKLNENDVSNFEGVEVEVRNGTNTQSVIPNFNDTFFTKPLSYVLTDTERTDTAQGNATEGIIVKVEFQKGLWHSNNEGKLQNAWVRVLGHYRQGTSGSWIPFVYDKTTLCEYIVSVDDNAPTGSYNLRVVDSTVGEDENIQYITTATITYPNSTSVSKNITRGVEFTLGYFKVLIPGEDDPTTINENFTVSQAGAKITGKQTSVLRKEFRVDNLTPDEYYVKMVVTERSNLTTDTKSSVECTWTAITSIVYDDFQYPNIALIGIKALATDQLNGTPTLRFTKTKSKIYAWNPHTNQYEEKNANNPAWASYDILHLCRYLENPNNLGHYEYVVGGVSADRMLYDQFDEWAEFCEDKGLEVNIEINQLGEMLDVINQKVAPIGHGRVLRFGTRYGCSWDCARTPVQMFGMGNIKAGTFHEQFLPTNDRANAVELTYMDADNGFERETITIMAEDYDTATEVKTAQATFDGITNYEQAYKEGKYQLFCNRYRIRTVTFEADIDSISCTIGDVVLVAHDVPKWAKSGRIYKVEGDVLTLPVELSDSTLNYRILYRTVNDNMYTSNCEILENADGWCVIKVASINSSDPPQPNDIFDIAVQNIGSKPFIIQNITRAKDFTRRIDCIEYDERIYNEDYDIPAIDFTEVDLRPKNVTNLVAREYSIVVGYHIDVSWQQASAGSFNIFFFDGENWHLMVEGLKTSQYSADIEYDAVQVRVVTVSGIIASSGTVANIENIDSVVSALTIENLQAKTLMDGNTGTVTATWDDILATSLKNYVVSFRGSTYNTLNPDAEFDGVPEGTYTLSVRAKTINGTYGNETNVTVYAQETINNTVAYSKTVPANKTSARLKELGGRTIVWNQLISNTNATNTSDGITTSYDSTTHLVSVTNNSRTTNYGSGSTQVRLSDISIVNGHKYFVRVVPYNNESTTGVALLFNYNGSSRQTYSANTIAEYTNTNSANRISLRITSSYDFTSAHPIGDTSQYYINVYDLTKMFGAGNEPSTVEQFEQMFSASYYSYNTGVLLNAKATTVTSKDADLETIGTYTVASYVQTLTGYGLSCPTAYNYIDFIQKKFVQNVGNRTYSAGDENDVTVFTDGTNTYYELTNSVETDISAYVGNNIIDVEDDGTLTFANNNGDNYKIPIPSTVAFS